MIDKSNNKKNLVLCCLLSYSASLWCNTYEWRFSNLTFFNAAIVHTKKVHAHEESYTDDLKKNTYTAHSTGDDLLGLTISINYGCPTYAISEFNQRFASAQTGNFDLKIYGRFHECTTLPCP